MLNHHMRTMCPECGRVKDDRARLCRLCSGVLEPHRLGTGEYKNHNKDGYVMVHVPEHSKANRTEKKES